MFRSTSPDLPEQFYSAFHVFICLAPISRHSCATCSLLPKLASSMTWHEFESRSTVRFERIGVPSQIQTGRRAVYSARMEINLPMTRMRTGGYQIYSHCEMGMALHLVSPGVVVLGCLHPTLRVRRRYMRDSNSRLELFTTCKKDTVFRTP